MGLRLTVSEQAWRAQVGRVAESMPGLVPVVKGNGYGFGREALMPIAASIGQQIAVGTVYEADDVPSDRQAIVLTPHVDALPGTLPRDAVLTVGTVAHVDALAGNGWTGSVTVKLRSSMQRYGTTVDDLRGLLSAITVAGLRPVSYSLHLGLASTAEERVAEIADWVPHLDPALPLSVSHLDAAQYAEARASHPRPAMQVRHGTGLWHADKSLLHLTADVLDVHPVTGGDRVGYRATVVPSDGHIALVAAGSAHGVQALDGGLSPFHVDRTRVTLLEQPHMHTSMLFMPLGAALPAVGDRVDVQRPLITTSIDELVWIDP